MGDLFISRINDAAIFFPLRLLTQKDLQKVCREMFEMADEARSKSRKKWCDWNSWPTKHFQPYKQLLCPALFVGSSKLYTLRIIGLPHLSAFFERDNLDAWKKYIEFLCADSSQL